LTAISPVGIFRVDLSGTVTYANQRWREITGLAERFDDSTGENYLSSVHPEDREWISDRWHDALENTQSYTFEVRWGTRDSFRWAMGEVVPEVSEDEVRPCTTKADDRYMDLSVS
jgi:PAS domain S-box-containing protein